MFFLSSLRVFTNLCKQPVNCTAIITVWYNQYLNTANTQARPTHVQYIQEQKRHGWPDLTFTPSAVEISPPEAASSSLPPPPPQRLGSWSPVGRCAGKPPGCLAAVDCGGTPEAGTGPAPRQSAAWEASQFKGIWMGALQKGTPP